MLPVPGPPLICTCVFGCRLLNKHSLLDRCTGAATLIRIGIGHPSYSKLVGRKCRIARIAPPVQKVILTRGPLETAACTCFSTASTASFVRATHAHAWGLFPAAVNYPGTSCSMVHRPHPLVMHWSMSTEHRDDALYGGTTLAVTHSFPPPLWHGYA